MDRRPIYQPGDRLGSPSGPLYDLQMVGTTDYMIASVLLNRVAAYTTNSKLFGYPTSLAAATGESNPNGVGIWKAALTSDTGSTDCLSLTAAILNRDAALGMPYQGIYYWKAVIQPGSKGTFLRHFDPSRNIRVGFTDFIVGTAP